MAKSRRPKNFDGDDDEEDCVTVQAEINLIRRVAYCEIVVGVFILLSQTVAIAASHEFATRSITGIWTSWFYFISAAIALFWSSRCTFNGLLAVLVFQIISATMGIPLFTACCLLFGVYPFKWNLLENGEGAALVGSSTAILTTNLIMMFCSIAEMILNGYNAYNCYFLAYGGKPKIDEPYDYEEYNENDDVLDNPNQPNSQKQQNGRNNGQQKQTLKGNNQQKKHAPTSGKTFANSSNNQNQKGTKSNQNSKPSSSNSQNKNQQNNDWNDDEDWGAETNTNTNYNNQSSSTYPNQSAGGNNDDDWGDGDDWGTSGGGDNSNSQNYNSGSGYKGNNSSNNQNHNSAYNASSSSNKQPKSTLTQYQNGGKKSEANKKKTLSPRKSKGDNFVQYDDPSMPQPPPDLTLATQDIIIIKYCGAAGVIFAFIIFSCQTAMLALASESGIKIGVGIWGALYYATTGVITVYNGWKPTAQSSVAIFILQAVTFVLSVPLVGIAYYIVAVFGSCIQFNPVPECPKNMAAGLTVTVLASVMAISGTIQGLMALILLLICSQPVCGIRCMISGATVYPTL